VLPGLGRAEALEKARQIQACIRETHYLAATGKRRACGQLRRRDLSR